MRLKANSTAIRASFRRSSSPAQSKHAPLPVAGERLLHAGEVAAGTGEAFQSVHGGKAIVWLVREAETIADRGQLRVVESAPPVECFTQSESCKLPGGAVARHQSGCYEIGSLAEIQALSAVT